MVVVADLFEDSHREVVLCTKLRRQMKALRTEGLLAFRFLELEGRGTIFEVEAQKNLCGLIAFCVWCELVQ